MIHSPKISAKVQKLRSKGLKYREISAMLKISMNDVEDVLVPRKFGGIKPETRSFTYKGFDVRIYPTGIFYIQGSRAALGSRKAAENVIDTFLKRNAITVKQETKDFVRPAAVYSNTQWNNA